MATKMTRAEYEAKYGTSPVTTSTSPVKKMTRSEYETTYGTPPVPIAQEKSVLGAGLSAGLESASNLPKSVFNFGKGIVEAVASPIDTAKGVVKTVVGGVEKLIPGEQGQEEAFNAFTGMLKERYGSLENLQKTATEDPFGFGTDVLGLVSGGAALAGKAGVVSKAIPKISSVVTTPASKVASATSGGIAKTARFGVAQATGLNPETITELIRNPAKFKNIDPEIRVQTANVVKDALDQRLSELSELGTGYDTIRNSGASIVLPEGSVKSILDKHGVVYKDGKILTTAESTPLSATDKADLAEFLNTYGNEPIMSGNSILNARAELSRIAGYDKAKTGNLQRIGRDIRSVYDNVAKRSIPELSALDAQYGPETNLLKQLKKDLFVKGELKDGAVSKIANITGKGKERVLERVKQIIPDIEERVKIIKTVEDIERASGQKVGAYARTFLTGGAVLTGNVPAIIGAIIAQPNIAVPLLKGAGYVGKKASPILEALKAIANDVNRFNIPPSLLPASKVVSEANP